MWNKIRALIAKYWDVITYLVFGVLTTVVNYLVYYPVYNLMLMKAAEDMTKPFPMAATISNAIAWVVAVAFAYLTNKPFVFKSHDWSAKTVIPELTKFVSCRVASGVMETVILFLTVDLLHWNGNVWKLLTSVLVVVLNYFGSKLLVFKK